MGRKLDVDDYAGEVERFRDWVEEREGAAGGFRRAMLEAMKLYRSVKLGTVRVIEAENRNDTIHSNTIAGDRDADGQRSQAHAADSGQASADSADCDGGGCTEAAGDGGDG